MPVDDDNNASAESPRDNQSPRTPRARGRRIITRRNVLRFGIVLAAGAILLILIGLIAYRLGVVDRYVAGEVKEALAKYGVRAEI